MGSAARTPRGPSCSLCMSSLDLPGSAPFIGRSFPYLPLLAARMLKRNPVTAHWSQPPSVMGGSSVANEGLRNCWLRTFSCSCRARCLQFVLDRATCRDFTASWRHPENWVSAYRCRWTQRRFCRQFGSRPLTVDLLFQDCRRFENDYAARRYCRLSAGFRVATDALLFLADNKRPERRVFNGLTLLQARGDLLQEELHHDQRL